MSDNPIIKANGRGLQLASMDDYMTFATAVSESGLAPTSLDTPQKVLVAVQMGAEVGLSPMQSLQSIAVINGKATVYGDSALALVRASGKMEYIVETVEGELSSDLIKTTPTVKAVCTVHRKGDPEPVTRTFSVGEARLAGLWKKKGPWSTHPRRMLAYKARAFALRDVFPDVLMGLHLYEEMVGETQYVESHAATPTCRSQELLEGDTTDAIRTEGQHMEPVPQRSHEGGEERPGVHGERDSEREGVLDIGVGESAGGQEEVLQRGIHAEGADDQPDPGRDGQGQGRGVPDLDNSVVSDGAAGKDDDSPHGTDATHASSEAAAEPVGAKEEMEGPTEPKDGQPAPVWPVENQNLPFRCNKCGLGYRVIPAERVCYESTGDGRCGGTVGRR